jgi:hypothetical protein
MAKGTIAGLTCTLCALAVAGAGGRAFGQEPKFEYGKAEEVKKVEWKVSAQAGLILTSGNSRTTTTSIGAAASRKAGDNKFGLEVSGAYAKADLFVPNDLNLDGDIDPGEIGSVEATTTKAWSVKTRYDRFFTKNNSGFVVARLAADEPAGKELLAGGQIGYSRQIFKNAVHEVVGEGGYDYSYENYVAAGDAISVHSARLFAGYNGTLSDSTGVSTSIEVLLNLNEEDTPAGTVDPLDDTRMTGKASLTTKLSSIVSFRFGFLARYDNAPAPRPPFAGIAFASGFVPLAEKLDTQTEVALIINLL